MKKKFFVALVALVIVTGAYFAYGQGAFEALEGRLLIKRNTTIKSAVSEHIQPVELCQFYNEMRFDDEENDVTGGTGYPSYVDIKSLTLRQMGDQVQFVWEGGGSLKNDDNQYYFILLDTDFDSSTGQQWGPVGTEIKIGVAHTATINYFEGQNGQEPYKVITDIPVVFNENKFYLNIPIEYINLNSNFFSKFFSISFDLFFDTSGDTPYRDEGSVNRVKLRRAQDPVELVIQADKMVLKDNPPLVAVEEGEVIQLEPYILQGNNKRLIPQDKVIYEATHPVGSWDPRIGDLSEIISIAQDGTVRYERRPGFIFVNGFVEECGLNTEETLVIATGTAHRNGKRSNVISVFPDDYSTRESGTHTFGEMFDNFDDVMRIWDLAYDVSSEMYGGYKPFDGDKQIFSMDVSIYEPGNPFACGNNNPLESDPTCYMNPDGSPGYGSPIHEMGHNFGASNRGAKGMQQLLYSNGSRIGRATECVASLPIIYMYADITWNPEKYSIDVDSYEYNYFKGKLEEDIPTIYPMFDNFENQITNGEISGYFDDGGEFDKVAVFCDFFQLFAYDLSGPGTTFDYPNVYKQEVIPRFLGIFSDRDLPSFNADKAETYFGAAYSAAVGIDMRDRLRFWGFDIEDNYFMKLYKKFLREM